MQESDLMNSLISMNSENRIRPRIHMPVLSPGWHDETIHLMAHHAHESACAQQRPVSTADATAAAGRVVQIDARRRST
jgi:hypothetical protein